MRPKLLALIIVDGWGENTDRKGNAIKLAKTPYMDSLCQNYPHTLIQASGEAVGLPEGQMGNSEVGHLNIGSGRIVYQDFTRISMAVRNNELLSNPVLKAGMEEAKAKNKSLHLMGLLSDGGVHSHIDHLFGLLDMAKELGIEKVYIHAILDGRDVPPSSAKRCIEAVEEKITQLGIGSIATVSGRYYTMDRDQRWERVEKAYQAMVFGNGRTASSALDAVEIAYNEGETDEFVSPTVIANNQSICSGDSVIFCNFRADRARQITRSLALEDFDSFERKEMNLQFICMTEYDETFNLPTAFPSVEIKKTFSEVISNAGLKQLRIAETEKYAHVTFFFNGGKEEPAAGEIRKMIPSPKVATYDQKPSMSALEVTDALLEELASDQIDVVILNYANCDMVGHTGDLTAAIEATEVVDECLAKLVPIILEKGGQILLTSDHGNAEKMENAEGAHTAHTIYPVPLIYVGGSENTQLKDGGILADIAPTMLEILDIKQPKEMTGKSLLA